MFRGSELLDLLDEAQPVADADVLRFARRAMATTFEVLIPFGMPTAHAAAEDALDLIDDLEDQLTVYREHSEVSRLNASGAENAVEVEPNLFQLLEFSASLTKQTHGAFDIATGALIKAWGFYKREGRVPDPRQRAEALAQSGSRLIAFDRERSSVKFLRRGLEINLGSIGKGYALDRAAMFLNAKWRIGTMLLHGGTSSVLAVGSPSNDSRGWPVCIKHPWNADRRLGTVHLNNAALGTSAATFQHFDYNGKKLGHLLDPRTGWPAEGIEQVSVIAPTATEADALSTAFFVLGPEATARYCKTRPDVSVVMLPAGQDRPLTFNVTAWTFSPDSSAASVQ